MWVDDYLKFSQNFNFKSSYLSHNTSNQSSTNTKKAGKLFKNICVSKIASVSGDNQKFSTENVRFVSKKYKSDKKYKFIKNSRQSVCVVFLVIIGDKIRASMGFTNVSI